jgi:hypothetical protein
MIAGLKERGYKAGYKAAKEAKSNGSSVKTILKLAVDDRKIANELMEEFKEHNLRWDKCFRLAVKYSFGFDSGVLTAVYE